MPLKSFRTFVFAAGLISSATQVTMAQAVKDASIDESFYSGSLRLSYSVFGKGASGGGELLDLYRSGKWVDLVKAVTAKRFVVDTYYFYLGRAAEELGYPSAASRYYQLAIDTSRSDGCTSGGMWNTCAGFSLPAEAIARRDALTFAGRPQGKSWPLGEGPIVSASISAEMELAKEAAKRFARFSGKVARSKFETDEEYRQRVSAAASKFLVLPVPISDESRCKTSYNHGDATYKIAKCTILAASSPFGVEIVDGEPLVLANAYDRREVRRALHNTYYLDGLFTWSAEYKLPAKEAEALESDLMAGIEVQGFSVETKCSTCEKRELIDSMNKVAESMTALSGKGRVLPSASWKDDAFKAGVVDEYWDYLIKPSKIVRFVVFRKSDQKILFEQTPN